MSEVIADKAGSAIGGWSSTLYAMLSTFGAAGILAGIRLTIFLVLRKNSKRYYAPRTYLGSIPEHERTPALPNGLFNWVESFWKIPDAHSLRHHTLDAYLFLRFLRICTIICFTGLCMTWPILFPLNITGGGSLKLLDMLSMSNINTGSQSKRDRLYAHVLVGWLFYGFVLYMILRECIFYINLRQAYLLAPQHARRISSRTVLFTYVPDMYLNEARLHAIFGNSAKRIWITRDTKELETLVKERTKIAMKLEKAEVNLLKLCNKERLKAIKKGSLTDKKGALADKTPPTQDHESGSISAQLIPNKKRPSHRLGPLGLVGKKVDTIEWCRSELQRLIPRIETAQANYKALNTKAIPAIFVEFHTQSDAQAAFQVLTCHHPLHIVPKHIGVRPEEIIWKNLSLSWWQRTFRRYAIIAFILALIIFWFIPVIFVTTLSQISYLASMFKGLSFINKIPEVVHHLFAKLLSAISLIVLMALIPVILKPCGELSGELTDSRVELFAQNAYFTFQVAHVFLAPMLSTLAMEGLILGFSPSRIFEALERTLFKVPDFYIILLISQGLIIAVSVIDRVFGFIIFHLMYRFFTKTPRALYKRWTTLSAVSWAKTMPIYANIIVISVVFAVTTPLVLFWATITMALFYLAYRYNILFVSSTQVDTCGLIYPRAMKQIITGVYLAQICMIFLTADSKAAGPAVLMVVFFILTILFHITMNSALDPLLYSLPRTLQVEEEAFIESARGYSGVDGQELDNAPHTKTGILPRDGSSLPEEKGNFIMKFMKPWWYASYMHLRKLVSNNQLNLDHLYEEHTELNSYYPPSVFEGTPLLWIPEDKAGVSKQEIALTNRIIPITDEDCKLDDRNKIVWDTEGARPPIYDEKIYY